MLLKVPITEERTIKMKCSNFQSGGSSKITVLRGGDGIFYYNIPFSFILESLIFPVIRSSAGLLF